MPVRLKGQTVALPVSPISAIGSDLKVPFPDGKAGYPLTYSKLGVDSPRNFAWKMVKGNARVDSTAPEMNIAGVDAFGLLTGALSMTGFYDRILDLSQNVPAKALDSYFSFTPGSTGVLSTGDLLVSKISRPAGWDSLRFETGDLERCSVVVPDLADIQLGDIVVHPREQDTELGIVVGLPSERPVRGTDERDFMNKVVVLSVREGFRQVTVGTWGNTSGLYTSFSDNPLKCHVRRFIVRNSAGQDSTNSFAAWDMLDYFSGTYTASVGKMREQSANPVIVKERWIPNTGEFLLLDEIKLTRSFGEGSASFSLPLPPSGDGYEIVVTGAIDRGYTLGTDDGAQGNIYKNTDGAFEVALVNPLSGEIKRLGDLVKVSGKPSEYYLNSASGLSDLYDETGKNKHSASASFASNRLFWDDAGYVTAGTGYYLGIRPKTAASARAGDDLFLQFGIRRRGESKLTSIYDTATNKYTEARITLGEADYVAVYDKKLLWRANLYIDQKEESLGNMDWNDAHKWDSSDNKWNRTYDGTSFGEVGKGGGGQVLKFRDFPWTPLRTKAAGSNNFYDDRISYDYDDDGIGIRAWDSPFDFVYKIQRQHLALTTHFGGLPPDNDAVFPNTDTSGNGLTNYKNKDLNLLNWKTTKAPNNKWRFYWRSTEGGNQSFIPSLGLHHRAGDGYDNTNSETPQTLPSAFATKVSAGTDCVGFAQRVASYEDNTYSWTELGGGIPKDRAEGNENPDVTTRAGRTGYPMKTNNFATGIVSREALEPIATNLNTFTVFSDDPNTTEAQKQIIENARNKLLEVIPGDIIFYGTSHIGIVHSVNSEQIKSAKSIMIMMSALEIIESYFYGNANYVGKRKQGVSSDQNADHGSWHYNATPTTMRKWEIVRLKARSN